MKEKKLVNFIEQSIIKQQYDEKKNVRKKGQN
jgi:hypothetical protein